MADFGSILPALGGAGRVVGFAPARNISDKRRESELQEEQAPKSGVKPKSKWSSIMSLLDKVAAAVAPLVSDETRAKAHAEARALSRGNDWLGQVLDHHEKIDALFDQAKAATTITEKKAVIEELDLVLTGHSIAEEAVLYPALVKADYEGKATMAYGQQATAKTEMFLLDGLDPNSEEWADKLEHIISAVRQHVYQEESSWFVDLVQSEDVDQTLLDEKYTAQFDRYVGADAPALFKNPALKF